ncbi:LOW QUALITY PROTEIN: serine/arginine repetitive matrix protein 1-like [Penaeus monodon]|uniref:LOW QUALITY PROTEIN: serine/arginine repetitive matrix protein 1-like n=1 Tax=Penaeus monodon TaxID=6687 RepID=UPI0018A78854|nr:LOW QUALITY PROTEIN: serine/arginine repetitive matrix protein 1-like [Penaeus monodon]
MSSRASSRASSRSSHRPRRPSVRASKIRREGQPLWFNRERDEEAAGPAAPPQWESSTLNRAELRAKKDARQGDNSGFSTVQRPNPARKYSAESSASSEAPRPGPRRRRGPSVPDYRSLPNRSSRSAHRNAGKGKRATSGPRGVSPPSGVAGSAGSSLQSSESEVDSHGGSHASRASKASRVSTGSNRSVYLHATAVADIPVRRASRGGAERAGVNRQTKKVSRSFSLLAPWKPRHYREKYEVEYDNREAREARGEANNSKARCPPGRRGARQRGPRQRRSQHGPRACTRTPAWPAGSGAAGTRRPRASDVSRPSRRTRSTFEPPRAAASTAFLGRLGWAVGRGAADCCGPVGAAGPHVTRLLTSKSHAITLSHVSVLLYNYCELYYRIQKVCSRDAVH